MDAPRLFLNELRDGKINVPFCPALTQHVYAVFQAWHRQRFGTRPPPISGFVPAFMVAGSLVRLSRRFPMLERAGDRFVASPSAVAMRRVLLLGEKPVGVRETKWIADGTLEFGNKAAAYCGPDFWTELQV